MAYLRRNGKALRSRGTLSGRILGMVGAGALFFSGVVGAAFAPQSHAVEGFPVIDPGSGTAGDIDPNWDIATSKTEMGGSYTSDGWVRLTDNSTNQITNLLNKTSFSGQTGFTADFDYRVAGGSGLGLGDGFSFYLTDGDAVVSNGGAGLGLAYAQSNTAGYETGVAGGVFGVGFDVWGSFSNQFSIQDCSNSGLGTTNYPNSIGIRGSGNAGCLPTEYPLIGTGVWSNPGGSPIATADSGSPDPSTVADSQYRHVRITVTPPATSDGDPTVSVAMSAPVAKSDPFGELTPVITNQTLTGVSMSDTLKLGFGASTGGATCFVDLRNIAISALADAAITGVMTTVQPTDGYKPGANISATFTASNLGPTPLNTNTESAMPLIATDWSALPVSGITTSTNSSNGVTDYISTPTVTDGKVSASWWAGLTTSPQLSVNATIDADAPAGDYEITAVIPTDFTTDTIDSNSSYITPGKGVTDPNLANNTKTLNFTVAQVPGVTWSTPSAALADGDVFKAGSTVNFTFPFTNTGNTPETITADVSAFTGTDTQPTLSCPTTEVAQNGTGECTATYVLTQEDVDNAGVSLSATATATSANGTTITTGATPATLSITPLSSLSLTKTASDPAIFAAGEDVTFTFDVTNTGNSTLTSIAIDDAGTSSGGTVDPATCDDTPLAPQATTTCTSTYTMSQDDIDADGFLNHATATGIASAGNPAETKVSSASAQATVIGTPINALTLTKSVTVEEWSLGGTANYSFELTNTGAGTLTFDPTTTNPIDETEFSGTGTKPVIDCSGMETSLPPQNSTSCDASYTITQDDLDEEKLTNTATATGTFDSDTVVSKESTATYTGHATAALTVVPSGVSPETWATGEEASISVTVVNSGQVDIVDPIAVDLTGFTTATQPTVTCPATPNGLAPGASITCKGTYDLTLEDANEGHVTFTATASGDTEASGPVESEAVDATFSGTGLAALDLTKTAEDPDPFEAGKDVTYTFEITNTGAVTIKPGSTGWVLSFG